MNNIDWLQYFADAGTVVNATGNYVNAYDGTTEQFAGKNDLSAELKAFYDTELLENARTELFYAQFAKRQPLPANHKGSVEWRKWNTFAKASKLTEGVIPTGQKFGLSKITGSIDQYGTYTSITDKLELRAYDDIILGATEEMGASAAETQETLIRDALLVGTNVMYCDNIDKDTGKVISTPTSCAQMGAGGVTKGTSGAADTPHGWALLTAAMINKAVTIMKKNRVPKINNYYYAVIHPSVAHDLRQDEGWIEAHKYAAPDELFNGEIGELHGVRFIENTFAPILGKQGAQAAQDDAYVNQERGRTYATYFFGKDSFGIIDPEGGALEMIVHDKSEIGGPLNQFSTIGYKFETNGATILYPERLLRVMSVSSFSATDEVN
ncbi:MAG: N4-gp56 family major capsid protein [Ruminococcus bromii]|jgi:N4-gp56 family major capsid protein|nr:N4-gp56 family major capsid protein [Ruminococcus bromii]MDY4223678.1 N4-gp56 family major capsid protein [Candidatus Limivicinus sp.]